MPVKYKQFTTPGWHPPLKRIPRKTAVVPKEKYEEICRAMEDDKVDQNELEIVCSPIDMDEAYIINNEVRYGSINWDEV